MPMELMRWRRKIFLYCERGVPRKEMRRSSQPVPVSVKPASIGTERNTTLLLQRVGIQIFRR